MLHVYRPLLVSAVLIAVGAGLIYFGAEIVSRRQFSDDHPAGLRRDETDQMGKELESRREILMGRAVAKQQAVRHLLAGRLTLLEAAAQFRDAERTMPITWGPPRPDSGGPAEGERFCRDVVLSAHYWLEENLPAQAAHVTARLEAELQQLRGPDGIVHLPD
ncbi:MAG: hypothetical protein L0Y72_26745 [Gemmataceae bacterium]|nr:hypothetical protein [Gemmataceae bacterium]MCI0742648.1 hypothetical protein [Gemmataceae bacterium]